MPDKDYNILQDLKNYEVAPPAFLFGTIKTKIEEEENFFFKKALRPLSDILVMPATDFFFNNLLASIREDRLDTQLKTLSAHKVPPPYTFEKILAIIKGNKEAKVFSLGSFINNWGAAAAVILLVITGYFTLRNNNKIENTSNIAKAEKQKSISAETQIASIDASDKKPAPPSYKKILNKPLPGSRKMYASQKVQAPLNLPSVFTIDGNKFDIIDNDFLVTFASFTEKSAPSFLQAVEPSSTYITIDKYTALNISAGMGVMLKKMYKTKRNGKATRRARRQKEKMENWKKVDADYFNENSTKNPIDPIDLGEFILHK